MAARMCREFEAARENVVVGGLPMNISTIELIEIGAGGGSIAHVDAMGLPKVGREAPVRNRGRSAMGAAAQSPR